MAWDWNNYFKFITVRNPWDMLVSFYHYGKPDENGNSLVDLIIKMEDLEIGLKKFFDHVQLPEQDIPHINATRHDNYKKYYTPETREKIREIFKYDIEMGNYEF
jgi:hypothetical protein